MFSEDPELPTSPPGSGGQATAPSEAGKTAAEAPQRDSMRLHHRYYRLLRRSRLMVMAFGAAMGYFVFWAVPWFPGGLDEKDYTERVALTLLLGGFCGVLGIGTLTPIGLAGALFHMLNNSLYKNCLFLCAGAVEQKTGTTELSELGGLARCMPATFMACLIASM